jgi:hypothetical protein
MHTTIINAIHQNYFDSQHNEIAYGLTTPFPNAATGLLLDFFFHHSLLFNDTIVVCVTINIGDSAN